MSDEIEIDESYFLLRYTRNCVAEGAKRVRGKRGRGAGRKTPVFGMLKRNGCVYTLKHLLCQRATAYNKGLFRA